MRYLTNIQKNLSIITILYLFIILFGLLEIYGGIILFINGGSLYYIISGALLVASGIFLQKRRIEGAWIFAGVFFLTLIWTIWERGFVYWAWIPRLDVLVVLAFVLGFQLPKLGRGVNPVVARSVSGASAALFGLGAISAFYPHYVTPPPADFQGKPLVDTAETVTIQPDSDWDTYGRDKNATRFSPLKQITPANVGQLREAWVYRTGALTPVGHANARGAETTPLKVGNGVYVCTPLDDIIKIDPATGKQIWRHNSGTEWKNTRYAASCRGVTHYVSTVVPVGEPCHERIITGTLDDGRWRLLAVDTETGQSCKEFGQNGEVNLLEGMGHVAPGMVDEAAPPPIVNGVIVTNQEVMDGQRRYPPSGVIRGYSAEDGQLLWAWDVKRPDRKGLPPAGETYSRGTPNSWAVMTGDEKLGLVYVPTGNTAVDYYSATRSPEELAISSSVVALDVKTGTVRWVYQTVHKDVWDYDIGSQATLLDFPDANGKAIPGLVIPTKRGQLFVLNRVTGQPLTRVEEKPAPQYLEIPEDPHSKTQPWSVGMPRLGMPDLTEAKMWGLTPLDQIFCRIKFRRAHYEGEFTAPTIKEPWIEFPGNNGGVDWGSLAYDPTNGVLVSNWNVVAMYNQLLPRAEADRRGLKAFDDPNYSPAVRGGEGGGAQADSPYAIAVDVLQNPFTGVLCNEPPYGMITAIDMHTQKVLWERPLGTARANGPFGLKTYAPVEFGVPSNGGPMITAGGLVFIAAATDNLIRAIDIKTGKIVWHAILPAGGQATPMTYEVNGQQYVAIVAGGHHYMNTHDGDYVIAYALPK
ncbi:glucose dehydrogenase [Gluconobacter oxydans]|uniref:membrane-bound PQQ-dependent dehydrogenase, glucose/quinate/shikimate family n=1 Tax=Gluconobacter thailandicus TaxID=257438 RepID=UPI0005538732|nr:membrane-bound PQQ-dependent dehydrogenase, glucose/quinate/shikimate family [Gluconobacter thailandicus]ANQ41901.1 glucose dehydrogenase [Gluconobacter oxydans]